MAKKPNAEERYRASPAMKLGEDACKICGMPTSFMSTNRGYLATCGRRCGGIYLRRNLKADPVKFEAFREKTRVRMVKQWTEMEPEKRAAMAEKTRQSVNALFDQASPEERKRLMGIHKMASTPVTWLDCNADDSAQVNYAICKLFGMDDSWVEANRIACLAGQAARSAHG